MVKTFRTIFISWEKMFFITSRTRVNPDSLGFFDLHDVVYTLMTYDFGATEIRESSALFETGWN